MQTIAAIATGAGAGGIGIIRLSGPRAVSAVREVTVGLPPTLVPRLAQLARVVDADGSVLDEGLVLFFQGPRSFTGEDVVELQLHGAPVVLSMVLARLTSLEGVRLATAGEFTRRAFEAGRLELTRAEAVADLIAAESEAQVRAAAAQLSGALQRRLERVEQPLLELHAELEGALDFPDEAEVSEQVPERLLALLKAAQSLWREAKEGAALRRGARVVLFGPVNAGKSTLFNALVGAPRALVDAEPGTTRDTIEARVSLGGLVVTMVDTAGLRAGAGRVEQLGIERTRAALGHADLAVLVLPPDWSESQRQAWEAERSGELLVVLGKSDLRLAPPPNGTLAVSGATGEGVEALRATLTARLAAGAATASASVNERHVETLSRVVSALERAHQAHAVSTTEVVSGELAVAAAALAELTGADASTALLDAIFRRFCIGK